MRVYYAKDLVSNIRDYAKEEGLKIKIEKESCGIVVLHFQSEVLADNFTEKFGEKYSRWSDVEWTWEDDYEYDNGVLRNKGSVFEYDISIDHDGSVDVNIDAIVSSKEEAVSKIQSIAVMAVRDLYLEGSIKKSISMKMYGDYVLRFDIAFSDRDTAVKALKYFSSKENIFENSVRVVNKKYVTRGWIPINRYDNCELKLNVVKNL